MNMDAFTPQQTIELVSRTGCKKAHMRLDKLFVNSFMAGPLLGFGCAIVLSVNASPWYQENAPGLIRMVGALLFPVGLVMIVLSGADLWTTNIMYMTTAFLQRQITLKDVLISWTVSFFGNLAGSLFAMAIIFGYGGVFTETEGYREAVITFVKQKAQSPQWHQIFLRAIGANWLVCFAVFSSIQAREVVSKIVAIWWPTATFVALGLDHTIANMFFIPMGIFIGAPFGVGYYIWKSMIPSALGNLVGGGVFVAAVYWYLYLTGEAGVQIAFNIGGAESAVDGGVGPMKPSGRNRGNTEVIHGRRPNESRGTQVMSAFTMELGDDSPYAKTYEERMNEKASNSGV